MYMYMYKYIYTTHHQEWGNTPYKWGNNIIYIYIYIICSFSTIIYSPLFIFSEQPVGIDLLKSQIIKLIIKTSDKINVISSLI